MVTLQQLKYFRELAATGHLTQTAERLFITQTTLSNTIINLEKRLGVKLFDRSGRTLQLNEAGKVYLKYVNEAMLALENADRAIRDIKKETQQSVSVAMPSPSLWSDLIYGFHKRHSGYSLRQIAGDSRQLRQLLTEQQIDYVIAGTDDISLSGLEHYVIRTEQLYLMVSREHPLAKRKEIKLTEAAAEPFINLPESNSFRSYCDNLFKKAGLTYRAELECDYSLRSRLVEAGFGVAITTSSFRKQNTAVAGIAYIPITDSFANRPLSIIWNPKHYLGKAALDFRDYVMETEL